MSIKPIAAAFFSLLVLAPQVVALFHPYENWPFTSAPMFAHYVDEDTPRYRFRFVGVGNGAAHGKELSARTFGLSELRTIRHFFSKVYGSAEADSPFGHPGGGRAAFERRLSRWFAAFVAHARKSHPEHLKGLRQIHLEVVRLTLKGKDGERRRIGTYSLRSKQFVHTYGLLSQRRRGG